MSFFQNLSIRQKLTAITWLASTLALILGSIAFIIFDSMNFREEMTEELSTFAQVLGDNLAGTIASQDEGSAHEILASLKKKHNIISALIYQADGEVFASYHRDHVSFNHPLPEEDGFRFTSEDLVLFQTLELEGDTVGKLYLQSDLEGLSKRRSQLLMEYLGLVLLVGIGNLIASIFTRKILSPLEGMTNVAVKIAEGDFTQEIKIRSGDEIGVLGNTFSQMSGSLREMIKKIKGSSQQIASVTSQMFDMTKKVNEGTVNQTEAAENTSSSVTEMNASMHNITENIDSVSLSAQSTSSSIEQMSVAVSQVANNTTTLATSVEDTARLLEQNSSSIKEVVRSIDTLSDGAGQATSAITEVNASIKQVGEKAKESMLLTEKVSQDAVELGMEAVEKTIEGMKRIKETVDQSSRVINKLGDRTEHIGKILTVISDITEQTNLLALNAAILAAQAGGEGKGFAVVADEIKDLAERTAASTQEIDQLIKDVQSEAKDAVVSISKGTQSVEEGVQLSMNTKESLDTILKSSKRSSEMSSQIEKATSEQVKATNQATKLIESMNVMVQQIHSAMKALDNRTQHMSEGAEKMKDITRQVKTSTEEQAKGSQQISKDVENVTTRIQQIANALNEQERGNEVITRSSVEIREITRVSAELMQQMNLVLDGLIEQSAVLDGEVGRFKV